jgi:hypothetical protein
MLSASELPLERLSAGSSVLAGYSLASNTKHPTTPHFYSPKRMEARPCGPVDVTGDQGEQRG